MALPPDAPEGLCPRCLVAANLATQTEGTGEPGSSKPPPLPVGAVAKLFPHLEILECLGRGGMGAVYKARQPRLDRFVALKILSPEKRGNQKFDERFEREARALAKLHHPNIVAVYDFGETQGNFYLLMEFVDGLSLRQLLQNRRLSPPEALAIVPKICDALQYAHGQGIVHRDIKPENILMDKEGHVKIADFGIAKILGDGPRGNLTEEQAVGTPHYMSPEQIEKPQSVDHRADIYSLGVVFYEMLTGELPLGKFLPPSKKVHVDIRLDEIVLRALEKEPERRYQQAGEVKTQVETVIATSKMTAGGRAQAQRPNSNPPRWPNRFTRIYNGIAILVFGWYFFLLLNDHFSGSVNAQWWHYFDCAFWGFCVLSLVQVGISIQRIRNEKSVPESRRLYQLLLKTAVFAALIALAVVFYFEFLPRLLNSREVAVKSDYTGQTWFPRGDSIEIASAEQTANRMTVRGHFNLVSHDSASIELHITSPVPSGIPENREQSMRISKGSGDFELMNDHVVPGRPHVSMYADGRSFADVYFDTNEIAIHPDPEDTYTITSVMQILNPVDPAAMNDDFQHARVLARDTDSCTLEITYYPLYEPPIGEDPNWQRDDAGMTEYLRPGPAGNWDQSMRRDLISELHQAGIDPDKLTDKQLVERVSRWAMKRAHSTHSFCIWAVYFPGGTPAVYPPLREAFDKEKPNESWTDQQMFDQEVLGKSMFYNKVHGSCTSSSVYLATIFRALGIPTRIILCVPPFDPNDQTQASMFYDNVHHNRVRETVRSALDGLSGFDNHVFNEVYVGHHWVRLNYDTLGQPILDAHYFGLLTHIYTCSDLSEVPLAQTWGMRYFKSPADANQPALSSTNPYRLLSVQDHFGVNTHLENPEAPVSELQKVTIVGLYPAGSPQLPKWIDLDKVHESGTEFLIAINEWNRSGQYNQLRAFRRHAGDQFLLTAPRQPEVRAHLTSLDVSAGDGSFQAFGAQIDPEDKDKLIPGLTYTIQAINISDTYRWTVGPGVAFIAGTNVDWGAGSDTADEQRPASAETWSPTFAADGKSNLQKVLNAAGTLTDEGSYEDALRHYLWYFDHSRNDISQRGVRLSFALSGWIELGRRYPKARQALVEIRDADTRQFSGNGGYADLFQEIAGINQNLEDDGATVALFKRIEKRDPQLAGQCFWYAEDTLFQKGDYRTCRKYMGDPKAAFERIHQQWQMMKHFEEQNAARREEQKERFQAMAKTNALFAHMPDFPAPPPFADINFVGQVRQLIEILVATGSKADAENIQTKALSILNDPTLKTAVADAEEKIASGNSAKPN